MIKHRFRHNVSVLLVTMLTISTLLPLGIPSLIYAESSNQETIPPLVTTPSVPPLLITEIVPDSADIKGSTGSDDAYEYIEIYNNSDQPINFKDYKLIYRYPTGDQDDADWISDPDNVVIQPGKTLLFWLKNANNANVTMADFNHHFGTQLVENTDVVRISAGLISSRTRWLVIATRTGHEIASAAYNDGEDDTVSDMGVLYRYPTVGSNQMVKYSSRTVRATPGHVDQGQVPDTPISLPNDSTPPEIRNLSRADVEPASNVEFTIEAKDDTTVKTLSLFYKTNQQSNYTKMNLQFDKRDGLYRYSLDGLQLLGSSYIDYYVVASDGTNERTSETFRCLIKLNRQSPRIVVPTNTSGFVKGNVIVKAAAEGIDPGKLRLSIDGTEVGPTKPGLELPAFLTFEVNGADKSYKNIIRMGKRILHSMDYGITGFKTVTVPVDSIYAGDNVISFVAGSYSGPYDGTSKENLDDFDIRNVRLVLADGTVVRDPKYNNPAQVFDMGDNGRFLPVVDFTFTVAQDRATATLFEWNTSEIKDGPHHLTVTTPSLEEAGTDAVVDNAGPIITTNIVEGKSYKGSFVIEGSIRDDESGVDKTNVTLDNRPIQLPYSTSSAAISPGQHTLKLTSQNKSGQQSSHEVQFSTVEENPLPPQVLSPAAGAENVNLNPNLQVQVTDPTGDSMQVSFHRGYQYTAGNTNIVHVYRGASDTEPPGVLSAEGEVRLTEEEITKVLSSDNQLLTIDSTNQFPYLRYEVKLEHPVDPADTIELVWEGRSLPGRKVTLYGWDYTKQRWQALQSQVAGDEQDFMLRGSVASSDFVRDRTANLIIQDQIETSRDGKYSFVWMSDTQYYTQTLSHIMESEVNWIRDHARDYNIQYVFHTGDVVENAHQEYQWINGDRYMKVLEDAGIPYGVLAGNHDVLPNNDYTMYSKYFGEERFKDKPFYGESYKDNRGHYDLISVNGNDFIMVYMGWGEGSEEVAWLNRVLAEHPDRKAILNFHDYVHSSGKRSATGQMLYDQVVRQNPNVFMVLSGHYTGAALITDAIDDNGDGTPDRNVYQMLSDYQGLGEGGDGYMKLFEFDPSTGKIQVKTYSPYKNDYNYYDPVQYPDKDEFVLSADLTAQLKRVATDSVVVNVYSNERIGTIQNAASGQTVQTQWNGLQPDQRYTWYAASKDAFGGSARSDLWSFTTSKVLPTPQNARVTQVTDTTAAIAWDPIAGIGNRTVTYDVYKNDSVTASVYSTVYQATQLAPDTEYRFYVTAKSNDGLSSEPSNIITVKTNVNLSVIRHWIDQFIGNGELRGPLAAQLTNNLKQAEHQFAKGDVEKAAKHLEDFIQHLTQEGKQEHISARAKDTLTQKANALLQTWRK